MKEALFCLLAGAFFGSVAGQSVVYCKKKDPDTRVYDFPIFELDGETKTDLSQFKGQVLLIINSASFRKQYPSYNDMLNTYSGQGLRIVMFPSNTFYQEPKDGPEILVQLREKLTADFPDFQFHPNMSFYGKVNVNGNQTHPLYQFMKGDCLRDEQLDKDAEDQDIRWNYEKFLIDRNGTPRFRFAPAAWYGGYMVEPYLKYLLREKPKNNV